MGRTGQHTFLLQLAAFAVALVAIVTMPVCLDASNAPILDGDVLTITESRDVTQVMDEPGVHYLHIVTGVNDQCSTCQPTDPVPHAPMTAIAEDQSQRVAALPNPVSVGHGFVRTEYGWPQAVAMSFTTPPLNPPPRAIS